MTRKASTSAREILKQEIVLHVLYSGGGDATPDAIYNQYYNKPGHDGFKGVGLINTMKIIKQLRQETHDSVVIKELELICHGTSWRGNSKGEVVIDPPSMWVGDHRMTYDELRSFRATPGLAESFRHVKTLLITACNLGHYSQEYFNFRAALAQLLFPPVRTGEPYSVEVRSLDAYGGIGRWAQRGKPENSPNAKAVPKRVPVYGKVEKDGFTKGTGIMVEHFYKDSGNLVIDWEKSDVLSTLHDSLGWG